MREKNIIIICGHYGSGKTNFSINLALRERNIYENVLLIDMDVVNPYFRSSDYASVLTKRGIDIISPIYAGSTLDIPALSPKIDAALSGGYQKIIIDAGGEDAGATALGRFSSRISDAGYDMLYVANMYRPLVDTPETAAAVLKEIEAASRLKATGLVNNSHLGEYTNIDTVKSSKDYIDKLSELTGLPVVYTAVERQIADESRPDINGLFEIDIHVIPPWKE